MHRISVIRGDGIGPEVMEEGLKVLSAACEAENIAMEFRELPYSGEHYLKTGEILPDNAIKEIKKTEAIYLGAVGDPRVLTGVLEQGLLLKLRFSLDQYVNLRPIKLYPNVDCPLKNKKPEDVDFYVVRENTEDFYVGLGERVKKPKEKINLELKREIFEAAFGIEVSKKNSDEIAFQIGVISREGCRRVMEYAFELAKKKNKKKVTSVDKANVLTKIYSLWREVFEEVAKNYSDIATEFAFVDAITMWFVKNPEWYKVVVTPNMFGDIITDLGAMIQGGMGLAPGGNINPKGISMFEPIHGSAPKYAKQNVANPIATILAGALMMEQLKEERAAQRIEKAVIEVLKEGKVRTRDLGGSSKTSEVGSAVAKKAGEIEIW